MYLPPQPMATYGSTVAVQGRSHSNLDRVSEGHNRSRKSFGLCPNNIHSIMQPQAALNDYVGVNNISW